MLVQIENWHEYKNDGEQFFHTAVAAFKMRKKAFSTETLYNLICMAIEKFFMAFLMKNGDLADNHTMADMIHSVERHITLRQDLVSRLLFLDDFQDICALEKYAVRVPTDDDIAGMIITGEELRNTLLPLLEESQSS